MTKSLLKRSKGTAKDFKGCCFNYIRLVAKYVNSKYEWVSEVTYICEDFGSLIRSNTLLGLKKIISDM